MTDADTGNRFPRGIEIAGSAIIEDGHGKILFCRSPKWKDKWILPGGHIEPGERILDAIAREAEEEAGMRVTPVAIVSSGELIDSADYHRHAHFIYFDALCTTKDTAYRSDGREISECRWVTPEEALGMDLAETYDKTIADYLEYRGKH